MSDYGEVRHEDLAEFAQVYAVCLDAGTKHLDELKKLSPRRFALWEKILNPYSPQALRKTLDPFYKQHIVADGLVVAGSEKVSLYALGEAGYLANKMLANRPDVMRDLWEKRKMFVAVMAYCELQTDLPDCKGMSLGGPTVLVAWDRGRSVVAKKTCWTSRVTHTRREHLHP